MKRPDKDQAASSRMLTRRGLVVGGLMGSVLGVLALRMRTLQVEQAEQFRFLAEENRINIRLIPPARGLIYDRNGVLLAGNAPNYKVVITREEAGDVDAVLETLTSIVPLPEDDLERARREISRRSAFVPVTVADRLTWEQFSEIAVNAPALPGITTEVGLSRFYPLEGDFAHSIGYVGPVSDFDLERLNDDDPLLQIPRFQIGKTGIEAKYELDLRGSAGTSRIEVNAAGRVMRELDRQDGQTGDSLQLTLDHALQNYTEARLEGESAAVVVMDVEQGDIRAIASAPSFDPNKFVRGISGPDYRALLNDEYRPLADKTVQGTYPPGSTFKMLTALAALEEGVIGPEERVWCPGFQRLGRRRFHCWKRGGHGWMNLVDSLRQSCDVYYYEISQRVGIDKIAAMANRFGLGVKFDLPMSAVSEGLIPTRAWKEANRGEGWQVGDTLNSSIGQGFVLASPLQLAVMTARLATGRAVEPRLVRAVNDVPRPVEQAPMLGVRRLHMDLVQRAMYETSNLRSGTAYRSRIAEDEFKLAGKTGTSQVRNITAEERARGVFRNEDLPWNRRDHALFVGYAPYDNPKYAISVVVEHGGGGSKAAAPIARDVLLQALYGELPPLSAYPSHQRNMIEEQRKKLKLRPRQEPEQGRSRA
ncbi:penicillin-binding protein 2 [Tropicimonas sp. S265A]|uniref:penicillin-binding protein 2 n=1 Tax=Tropicimonas sp. S265A TaxID=3415134 RepID=UPI003C7C946B